MIELKPCPFCGGKASTYMDWVMELFYAECDNVNCAIRPKTPYYDTEVEAKMVWNRRAK